jgi:DNA polymerase III epsilon subunit family exonuclease
MITVADVIRDMGIELTPHLGWGVGGYVRDLWTAKHHGELPAKELRNKSRGGGTHLIAVYPEDWRKQIEEAIRSYSGKPSAQFDLFRESVVEEEDEDEYDEYAPDGLGLSRFSAALILDTETTCLMSNRILREEHQPSIIEFYGELINLDDGTVLDSLEHLIKPPRPIPEEITEITHISNAMVVDKPKFVDVADDIFAMIERAPIVIAHNMAFDRDVLDVEAARLGRTIKWPRVLCTVEQSIWLTGHRLSLKKLYEYLFTSSHYEKDQAHRARIDVENLTRIVIAMRTKGWL